jgi:hypothetical protein
LDFVASRCKRRLASPASNVRAWSVARPPTRPRADSNENDRFDPMVEWSGVPNGRLDDLGRHVMSEAP